MEKIQELLGKIDIYFQSNNGTLKWIKDIVELNKEYPDIGEKLSKSMLPYAADCLSLNHYTRNSILPDDVLQKLKFEVEEEEASTGRIAVEIRKRNRIMLIRHIAGVAIQSFMKCEFPEEDTVRLMELAESWQTISDKRVLKDHILYSSGRTSSILMADEFIRALENDKYKKYG